MHNENIHGKVGQTQPFGPSVWLGHFSLELMHLA